MKRTLLLVLVVAPLAVGACEGDDELAPVDTPDGEPPCEGFELMGPQARDLRTGLIWDRFVALSFATHAEADAACAARGARLPTRQELLAMRAPGPGEACQLPACPFHGDRCATIQCGSQVPGTEGDHWGVAFSGGALVLVPSGGAEAMICVR